MSWPRAVGLALGFAADAVFGDPERGHPVAGFGRLAAALERRTWADRKAEGVVHEVVLVGGVIGLGMLAPKRRPLWELVSTAAATFFVLGGTTLSREASAVADRLDEADLPGARAQVGRIVGRRTADLSATDVARAAVETVAENTSDAVVAPLFWGAVAGVPGLLGYRAINTLDAMVGHRSLRYANFGWAAAKLDDVANWIPARFSAALVAVVRPDKARCVARTIAADAAKHPSPNAGQVEASFAGALGVQLGGANTYDGQTEDRGTLGDGRPPDSDDIRHAVRLSRHVATAAAVACALAAMAHRDTRPTAE